MLWSQLSVLSGHRGSRRLFPKYCIRSRVRLRATLCQAWDHSCTVAADADSSPWRDTWGPSGTISIHNPFSAPLLECGQQSRLQPVVAVLKVTQAVQALGLEAALGRHSPVCWAAPPLPCSVRDNGVHFPSLCSLCHVHVSHTCYPWGDIIFLWLVFGMVSAWMGKCILHGDPGLFMETRIGFYLLNHR